jgi:hypothetical protein
MDKFRIIRLLSIASLFAFVAATASAQSLGTFRWQLAPYCNLVTVNVVQTGAVYTLDGWDDQCGNLRAPVVGAAMLNFDGSIELGMNIVTAPGGAPVHVAARITLPSASGQWSDSAGNSGAFILGGNPSGLAPRPSDGIGAGAINPAEVQARVTGVCPAGQLMVSINQDGGVNCQAAGTAGLGDITAVRTPAGTGLTGGAEAGDVALAVDFGGTGAATTAARSDHTHARPGGANTAAGDEALINNTPGTFEAGTQNTAFGSGALRSNTVGYTNTALGVQALHDNITGFWNAAAGPYALRFNTTGNSNTATGNAALRLNLTGNNNTADGARALENNQSGSANTAVGQAALFDSIAGSNNIAVGFDAGNIPGSLNPLFTGSGNIYIGVGIGPASATEANTIRIGNTADVTDTFIAGIAGQTVTGSVVQVNASGKLGITLSSARFKDDIAPLGESLRAKVQGLTPVSFIYKPEYDDGPKQIQYGLIAEEVAEKFPELLVRDADGQPQTVRYHLLTPLLLAEVQRLEREREAQRTQLNEQAGQIAALRELVLALQRQITTVQTAAEATSRVARPER